jgi:hypothetical protein
MKALNSEMEGIPYTRCPWRSTKETNKYDDAKQRNGETNMKSRILRGMSGLIPPQKTIKGTMHTRGGSREETASRTKPADDDEKKTTARRVETAQKPRRHSFIHHHRSKSAAKTAPESMNASQRIQQNNESATILLMMKMGSRLKIKLLTL